MDKKPLILFVFFQTSDKANGGLNSLVEIMLNLKDFRALAITQKETALNQKLRAAGVEVEVMPMKLRRGISNIFGFFKFARHCRRLAQSRGAQVLHLNDMNALMHLSPVLRSLKMKKIFNVRDVFEPHRTYGKKWRLVNGCDEILVLSEDMKAELLERLPLRRRLYWKAHFHITYSVVNFERFYKPEQEERRALRQTLGFAEGKIHWLFVAKFGDKKNQAEFIEKALPLIAGESIIVHFVGDFDKDKNPYVRECLKRLRPEDQDKAVFHGYQPRVEDFYKAGDLTIVPTRREGLARCMIESLSCGLPVVSFDVSSAREILETHQLGAVVPQGDYAQLVAEAKKWSQKNARNQTTSDKAAQLASLLFSAKNVIERYTNAVRPTKN